MKSNDSTILSINYGDFYNMEKPNNIKLQQLEKRYQNIKQDIEKLNNLDEVKIFQKTPIRVLHRRTVMIRPRIVSEIKAELIDEHHFRILMKTQAGT